MSEYIERESIRKLLMEVCSDENCPMFIAATIDQMIDYEPAADVAPVVHGKWNGWHGDKVIDEETQRKYHYYKCSECRRRSAVKSRFCPNCGAKMDEGTRNDG